MRYKYLSFSLNPSLGINWLIVESADVVYSAVSDKELE